MAEGVEHRLTAILAADVVGYSRMMSMREEETLSRLKAVRSDIVGPNLEKHRGKTIKLIGDGTLCEFPSAVEAVRCAIGIQRDLTRRFGGDADGTAIRLRIGVHLGDVIVEGDDLYGHGINIASRIEGLAQPGEVLVSDAVFQQVKGVDEFSFVSLGEQALKNIPEPILVYRVIEGEPEESIDIRYLLSKPAVAVLPFTNMSGDAEQEYFSDGLSEDLITALSYWKSFPVIARSSSFAYKGRHVDVRQVSKELGARYILEGSVRKSGGRVRVSAQLLDAETGYHVWSERMDRQLEDIFAIQDEITLRIASIVEPAIQMAEAHRGQAVKTRSLSAWDLYQRGNFHFYQFTPETSDLARNFYERTAAADPSYAPAFAGIARSWYVRIMLGQVDDHQAAISAAMAAARKAVSLDETDSLGHSSLGLAFMWSKAYSHAAAEGLRAVQCNPSDALAHIVYGNILDVAGRPEEGLIELQAGIRLNPLNPMMHQSMTWLAGACLNARRYSEALEWIENALLRDSGYPLTHLFLAVTLAHLGDPKKAAAALTDCELAGPGFVERFVAWGAYQRPEDNQHMLSGLRKAGWDQ